MKSNFHYLSITQYSYCCFLCNFLGLHCNRNKQRTHNMKTLCISQLINYKQEIKLFYCHLYGFVTLSRLCALYGLGVTALDSGSSGTLCSWARHLTLTIIIASLHPGVNEYRATWQKCWVS